MRIAILGAGAGGLGLAIRLKKAGFSDLTIFERSDGVGGTWRANTYPGAACDIQSHLYSFSFELNPNWSRTYAQQPEILAYLEHCADEYGLRSHLRCSTGVAEARWSDDDHVWRLRTEAGEEHEFDVLVSALGMLNVASFPDIEGLDSFEGTMFHSSRWDHDHDLRGERVAVIGTGASAIQFVPPVAEAAGHLTVFQRSPVWIMPKLDQPYSEEDKRRFARNPIAARRQRWRIYRTYEKMTSFRLDDEATETRKAIALAHLDRAVKDPELRARLTPDFPVGCKRILISNDFYPAMQRPNVRLVTDRIARITPKGVVTVDGESHDVDTIVLGTGFRASEYLCAVDVYGAGGRRLRDDWAEVPHAHLGMTVSGYPNFFMLYGPNTNQGGNSIIFILEAQARYVVQAVRRLRRRHGHGRRSLDVRRPVMERYNADLRRELEGTVWQAGCSTYFTNANGHIATQLPHPSLWYWRRTRRFAPGEFTWQ